MSEEEFNCLLEKGSSTFSICDIQLLKGYASSYKDKFQQKDNIIKEVRERIDKADEIYLSVGLKSILLEILDKENI